MLLVQLKMLTITYVRICTRYTPQLEKFSQRIVTRTYSIRMENVFHFPFCRVGKCMRTIFIDEKKEINK